ncbi:MAG TPA: gliding motility-associated C-terminal domain-containing protein, partial [Chitinophagaceae bacterium]|nr:gliding motility-associated C-terminal domain-containing protein [Chitinophagaceae bacterium]
MQNTAGCDSIITIHLTVNSQKTQQSIIICEGEYFYAGGANRLVSGVYLDTLIGSNGCDSIVTTHLTVNQKPMLSLGPDTSICRNTALEIHTGLFSTYLWQDGSTNESFYIHTPGLYWVRVTNSEGCEETDSLLIDGFIDPPTNFLSPLDSICPDQKLELKPLRSFIDYSWSTGAIQQIITIDTPGKYWLDVKSTEGCIGRDSVTVIAKDNCETAIYIPNAFTPNNDGNNDLFRATIFGDVKSFRLQVYDRAGQL